MDDHLFTDFCDEEFKANILAERKVVWQNIIEEWPLEKR